MAGRASTHHIAMRGGEVTKRFTSAGRGEPEREWRALRLLAEHAPGLAPQPIDAGLTARPPYVVMSRLDGTPLRGMTTTPRRTAAMARAIGTLHEAIPLPVLDGLPPASWSPAAAVAKAQALRGERPDLGADPTVAAAYAAGTSWLDGLNTGRLLEIDTPVFGPGCSCSAPAVPATTGTRPAPWNAKPTVSSTSWDESGPGGRRHPRRSLREAAWGRPSRV